MNKVRATVDAVGSIQSMQMHNAITNAVQPELDCMTEMQQNAVGGQYRPDVAVRLILEIEDARHSIMTACDALHRALHKASKSAENAQDRANERIY